MKLLIRLAINAAALWVAIELLPKVDFTGRLLDLLVIVVVFGLVNTFIRPIFKLLTLPLTLVTLGLFSLVVNGAMLLIAAAVSDTLNFSGSFLEQLGVAVIATIIISVVGGILSMLLPDGD